MYCVAEYCLCFVIVVLCFVISVVDLLLWLMLWLLLLLMLLLFSGCIDYDLVCFYVSSACDYCLLPVLCFIVCVVACDCFISMRGCCVVGWVLPCFIYLLCVTIVLDY